MHLFDGSMTLSAVNENPAALAENPEPMKIRSAEERLQDAVSIVDTFSDTCQAIDDEIARVQREIEAGLLQRDDAIASEAYDCLYGRKQALYSLISRYGSVQVAHLPAGIGGMAPVGGSSSDILVNADVVARGDLQDLEGVLVHEERHTDQVELQSGGEVKLIVDGKEVTDDAVLLEGDTETHVIDITGYDRNDRPDAVYGEGKEVADIIRANHVDTWNRTLTETGQVADLQNAVWINGVEQETLSSEEIADQVEKTGYMFNDAFIAAQNQVWAAAIESGKLDPQAVQDVANQWDIELSSEVNLAIAKVAAETRKMYQEGPMAA